MNKRLCTTLIALCACLPLSLIAHEQDEEDEGLEFEAKMVALNQSGVDAEIELTLRGNQLSVEIEASGLEPGRVHPQHIHGKMDSSLNADCPTLSADVNGDGTISVQEGLPNYGPIVLPLTPFNLVSEEGELDYKATFQVNLEDLGPLQNRAIVMHGMSVNGEYIPSLPIACGQLELD